MTGTEIDASLERMDELLSPMQADGDQRRYFLAVYTRTTRVVKQDLERGGFDDPEWTERWDIVFADLYLDALRRTTSTSTRSWRAASPRRIAGCSRWSSQVTEP